MSKLDAYVAFITGAARGQRRAHPIRPIEDRADIITINTVSKREVS